MKIRYNTKIQRLFTLVLAGLLTASVAFTAGDPEGKTTDSGDLPRVRYLLPWDPGKPISDELWSIVQWEEAVGVDFEIINPPRDTFTEQLTSLIASDKLPDMINFFRDSDTSTKYGSRLFADISTALEEGKLPNYAKYYGKYRPEFEAVEASDGRMYGFVQVQAVDTWSSPPWYIRNDILKTLGVDITEKIYTLDEYKDILLRMKEAHGGPLTGSRLGFGYTMGRFAHYFGAAVGMTSDRRTGGQGAWVFGPAQPSFKLATETFAWAYENGIFHPDMLTMDKNEFFAKLADGTFVLHMGGGYNNLYNDDDSRDVQLVIPPEMPDGVARSWAIGGHLKHGYRWPVSINKDSEVIDDALRAMDFLYSDEGNALMGRGIEGITYEIDSSYPTGYRFDKIIGETNKPNAVTALEQYGYQAQVVPVLAYGKSLFEEIAQNHLKEKESVIYVRAKKISFDPKEMFEKYNIDYNAIISYRTIRNELATDSVSSLLEKDAILFTAPSTVKAYQQQFGQPLAKPIAIGDTTATAMTEQNWDNIIIMETPDVNKVLEYI